MTPMKHKTNELAGVLLDAAVEKAEGLMPAHGWGVPGTVGTAPMPGQCPEYSTDWADGGPIIERERIILLPHTPFRSSGIAWWAGMGAAGAGWFEINPDHGDGGAHGPTPLIAAMRAYVVSKLGDEIDL